MIVIQKDGLTIRVPKGFIVRVEENGAIEVSSIPGPVVTSTPPPQLSPEEIKSLVSVAWDEQNKEAFSWSR